MELGLCTWACLHSQVAEEFGESSVKMAVQTGAYLLRGADPLHLFPQVLGTLLIYILFMVEEFRKAPVENMDEVIYVVNGTYRLLEFLVRAPQCPLLVFQRRDSSGLRVCHWGSDDHAQCGYQQYLGGGAL